MNALPTQSRVCASQPASLPRRVDDAPEPPGSIAEGTLPRWKIIYLARLNPALAAGDFAQAWRDHS
ncbi:MAG: hypothetical protein JWQ03_2376, partial [Variovorax sp.]|nr:hypothetical protein [Variovorax sp.]